MLTLFGKSVIISTNSDLYNIPHARGVFRQPSVATQPGVDIAAQPRFYFPSQPGLDVQKLTDFEKNFGSVNELDGCYHIYLDVGSNVGIQVRKLFEPKLYPNANILSVFESYFGPADDNGNREETVCAIGFEPNARHTPALLDVEQAHKACGWRSHFYTETAAAHDYGTIEFFSDNDMTHREWGGSIVAKSGGKATGTAKKMRLADYVIERILTRNIPESVSTRKPSILMKMDIEGSELEVLTDMIVSGALQVKTELVRQFVKLVELVK